MVTKEELEGFLERLAIEGASHREINPGMWIVHPAGALDADVVVHYSPPVVLLRMKVMDLPKDDKSLATLSRRLLQLNATDLVHGSYGIEGELDRAHRGARARPSRLRGIPRQLRIHDARARLAPPRARAVPRGTLTMGIFDRISAVLRSNINDLISRAEDPEKMLHQIIIDMRSQLVQGQAAGGRRDRR